MTTPTYTDTSSNKTALRASLKKEDESLAERLVATDVPLVEPPEPEAPVAPRAKSKLPLSRHRRARLLPRLRPPSRLPASPARRQQPRRLPPNRPRRSQSRPRPPPNRLPRKRRHRCESTQGQQEGWQKKPRRRLAPRLQRRRSARRPQRPKRACPRSRPRPRR
jgi:hypothetical protein